MELLDRIERFARDHPQRPAYVETTGRTISYSELDVQIACMRATVLRHAVEPGRTIALNLAPTATFVSAFLAVISSGANALLCDESMPPPEVGRLALRLDAAAIFSPHPSAMLGVDIPALSDRVAVGGSSMPEKGRVGDLLLPTSGSTGKPKIVRRNAASIDQVAANMVEAIGITAADRILAAVPLAHSYGLEHGVFAPLWAGATVHLFDGLDLDSLANERHPLSVFPTVPSLIERLGEASGEFPALRSLRAIYSAGAPLPDGVRERFVARFGRPIGQLYGATEIGTVTYRSGDARPGGDVGWPLRGVSIRTLDDGEIAIRSPSMFEGYVGDDAMLVDGHFVTGDLGRLTEDGALELQGRSKLLIDVGGLKVNPIEVETTLATHEQVAECLVVPVRQSETVSRLRAIIVPRDPKAPPTADAMRAFARARLASHKVPRSFELRKSPLPRSATGKVLRTMLSDP